MKSAWWMAPMAVLLLLAGVFGGIWIGRASLSALPSPSRVRVPGPPADEAVRVGSQATAAPVASDNLEVPAATSVTAGPAGLAVPAIASAPEPVRPPDQEAIAFAHRFMQARMAGDLREIDRLSSGLEALRISRPEARITGFQLQLLGSGDWDSFIFRVATAYQDELPGGQVIMENLRLSWRDGLIMTAVQELASDSLNTGASADGSLYLRQGSHRITAGSLADLPDRFTPAGADATVLLDVAKSGWAVVEPSFTGDHLFWATSGPHSLMGVTRLDQEGKGRFLPLDILVEGSVEEAVWSPGSTSLVAVLAARPSGGPDLVVWDLAVGERIAVNLDASAERMIRHLRWKSDGHSLLFDLEGDGVTTGPWVYDIQTRTLIGP